MKVCIVGAGAIGGYLGTRLALAGECEVSVYARGATLAALREHGWRLHQAGGLLSAEVRVASDDAGDIGPQDLVVIAVKGPALQQVAQAIAPLIGPRTVLLPAMNGVPWWFNRGIAALGDEPLASVDPGGLIAAALPLAQVLGCVVHASASTTGPGRVEHRMGRGLIIGEPDGGLSTRAEPLAALFEHAGFQATVSPKIRQDIWYKLWGNLTTNPVSAITGASTDRILDDPLVRAFCIAAMQEASDVGACIGCAIAESPEDRHVITRKLGAFKTSMLQDAEAGRALEIDSIVAAVHEIALRVDVPTPNIDALLGLARLYGRVRGLYPEASQQSG